MDITPFHHFIDFVQCNDQIMACAQLQSKLEQELAQLQQEHAAQQAQLEQVRSAARSLRKDIDARELEVAGLRQRKRDAEQKMERVTNPKEYLSLESETKQATAKIEQIEEAIMPLWQELEQADGTAKDAEKVYEQQHGTYLKKEAEMRGNVAVVVAQAQALQKECELKGNLVRPEWLEKFRALKTQLPNPVVAVKSGACGGCFYKVPVQIIARLERHELVPCPMCRRILYQV